MDKPPTEVMEIPWLYVFGLLVALLGWFAKLAVGLVDRIITNLISTTNQVTQDLSTLKSTLEYLTTSIGELKSKSAEDREEIQELKIELEKVKEQNKLFKQRLQE